jgi:virginiamycin B lyase
VKRQTWLGFLFASIAAAVGCSTSPGTHSDGIPAASGTAAASQLTAPTTFSIVIHRQPQTSAGERRRAYVSPGTQSLTISYGVVPSPAPSGATPAPAMTELDVASPSPACSPTTVVTPNDTLTCSVTVLAPVGNDAFTVATYPQTGGQGTVLSSGSLTHAVVLDEANVVPLTLTGHVDHVAISVPSLPPTCTATSVPLIVSAQDAAGYTIVGATPYDTPITVTFSDPSGATTLSNTTFSSTASSATLTYNGTYEPGATITAQGFSATTSPAFVFFPTPTVCAEYAITSATFPYAYGITQGTNGMLYFAEHNEHALGSVVETGVAKGTIVSMVLPITSGSSPTSATPDFLTSDANGNLWIADPTNGADATTTTGLLQSNFGQGTYQLGYVTNGPKSDGRIWYTTVGVPQLVAIAPPGTLGPTATATLTAYPIPGPSATATSNARDAFGLTAGPDGAMWIAFAGSNDPNNTKYIGRMTTDGSSYTEYPIPLPTGTEGQSPQFITSGADGKLYFSDNAGYKIGVMTTSGAVTEYPLPSGNAPHGIVLGPDGNVWFVAENYAGTSTVGRITPAGTITEYPIPTKPSSEFSLCIGTDNNVWFTETYGKTSGQVGYLVI